MNCSERKISPNESSSDDHADDIICEDDADNRHFVAKLKNWIDYPTRRDVYISFVLHSIHEIDVPRQRFHVLFTYYVAWKEDIKKIKIDSSDVDKNQWSKAMFEECFDPQLRLTNCFDWNENENEEWYRVVPTDKDTSEWNYYKHLSVKEVEKMQKNNDITHINVIKATRVQGWFEEDYELRDFPLDVQHLHIGLVSRWDDKVVAISYDKYQPSTISSRALASQIWEMSEPRLMSYRDDWDEYSQPLLTHKADSVTGSQYCKAYFAITVSRKAHFVLWNVMFIMILVGFFSFSAFALDPSNLGERQSTVLTLVLTTVAFKYVTINMLPEIPYLTMIDKIIYGCMLIQAFMLLSACISASISEEDSQNYFDKCAFIALGSFWACLLIWFMMKCTYLYRSRNKYLNRCNEVFGDAYERRESKFYSIKNKTEVPPHGETRYHSVRRHVNHGENRLRSSTMSSLFITKTPMREETLSQN